MKTCPDCKKRYSAQIRVCPECHTELSAHPRALSAPDPSAPALRKMPTGRPASSPSPRPEGDPSYINVLRTRPEKAQEIARILQKEGISCRVQPDESFELHGRSGRTLETSSSDEMMVMVPAFQIEKARALLDWETAEEDERVRQDRMLLKDEPESTLCPACEAEVEVEETDCPECGLDLNPDNEEIEAESEEDEFFCSSCGEIISPDEPECPNCGAHFDH